MGLLTTCIGAYPKPDYVPISDWFQVDGALAGDSDSVTRQATVIYDNADEETEALFVKATKQALNDQLACGVDIPSDGEQRRENYIHYHCRHLEGFDFENLTKLTLRDGAYTAELPTIIGAIKPRGNNFLDHDFRVAQQFSDKAVKITVPGPMTIMDTTANKHYDDEKRLAFDLAEALNFEIRALADAGCKYIQVDEPLFARNVERAIAFGIEGLERCFHGVPKNVIRVMHMCCGYPEHLDDEVYHKADPQSYFELADTIDQSSIDQVSIEDAHRHNDPGLLEKFQHSTVILGVIAIAQSRLESVEEVVERIKQILGHIDRERLVISPDCGLAMLGRDLAMQKLSIMGKAAKAV